MGCPVCDKHRELDAILADGPGTYSYFCRVHPFTRGSFRVVAR